MDCSTGEFTFPFNSDYCPTKNADVGAAEQVRADVSARAAGASPGLVNSLISRRRGCSSSLVVYPLDAKERHTLPGIKRRGGGMRQAVQGFSEDSRRRMLFTFRNVVGLRVLVTLTYPGQFSTDGREVKRHWDNMRRWLVRRGVSGAWFMEFQARGAPHFHCFLTGEVRKEEVAAAWFRIVGSGDDRHLRAGTRIEALRELHAPGAYAAKYLKKQEQKEVPEGFSDVGRFWGLFGGLSVQPVAEVNSQERIDTSTGEVVSGGAVQAARVMRGLVNAKRRAAGRPKFKDSGRQGFTGYNCGPAMAQYLSRVNPDV